MIFAFQATDCKWVVAHDLVEPAGCRCSDITSDSLHTPLQVQLAGDAGGLAMELDQPAAPGREVPLQPAAADYLCFGWIWVLCRVALCAPVCTQGPAGI